MFSIDFFLFANSVNGDEHLKKEKPNLSSLKLKIQFLTIQSKSILLKSKQNLIKMYTMKKANKNKPNKE